MGQKEKQEHMLRTAKKKYGMNIRITSLTSRHFDL